MPYFFTGERTLLVTTLIWTTLFHLVWRPVHHWRRLLIGAAAGLVALVVFFQVVGQQVDKTIETHPEIVAALNTRTLDDFALAYVYVTANIPTLSQLMEDPIR